MKAQDLKNSILQMAMKGKLVPQDPNDEPASVLLERIKEEKEQLIKENKIKRNKNESIIFRKNNHFYEKIGKNGEKICIDEEIPWEIPDNWEWVRFGTIVNFSMGKTPQRKNPEFWENGTVPWVSIADMKDREVIYSTKEKVNETALEKSFKNTLIPKDTLLMSFKLTVGKVSILGMDAVHNEAIISINPFIDNEFALRDYLFWILPIISQFGDTKSAIKGKTLNSKSLNNLLLPLPNLNEQKRIVEKLYELNPFIEQYGGFEISLENLNNQFPNKIKDSILQEAIQGKLVPQDPNDEPATVLLEKIRAEKEHLIKEKKIKINKNESFIFKENNHFFEKIRNEELVCIDDELPFNIPSSWNWVRLNSLGEIVGGGTPKTTVDEYWNDGDIPWLTPADMKFVEGKYVRFGKRNITNVGLEKSSAKLIPKNSIIYSSRAPIGYIAIAKNELCTNQGFKSLVPYDKEIVDYIYYCLIALTKDIQSRASGTTFKEISGTKFGETLIPLPPLNEQKRIISRIEKLITELNI